MMGHKICFSEEIWIIIPKLSLLLLLIWSPAYRAKSGDITYLIKQSYLSYHGDTAGSIRKKNSESLASFKFNL